MEGGTGGGSGGRGQGGRGGNVIRLSHEEKAAIDRVTLLFSK